MRESFLKLVAKTQILWRNVRDEQGQDLVEYAAVLALIVLAVTAGMSTLAQGINNAMGSVTSAINTILS